jgi:hypothetical protein
VAARQELFAANRQTDSKPDRFWKPYAKASILQRKNRIEDMLGNSMTGALHHGPLTSHPKAG